MKRIFIAASLFLYAFSAVSAKGTPKDPVLMTIDGKPVHVSEFQYLYNKNHTQQAEPLTLDKYVDMFVDYKLKVADAHAAGIDTTRQFIDEFIKFRGDLAAPYMSDQAEADRILHQSYANYGHELYVRHIMMPPRPVQGIADPKATIDSIAAVLAANPDAFDELARKHSIDRGSADRGGAMGWMTAGRYPWLFEEAAYQLQPGQISEPVNSGFGYHIIKVDQRRPTRGEVNASHILLMTRGLNAADATAKKTRIDSIYREAVKPGANFEDLARRFSEDTGSAVNGGNLGWFGSGVMVAEFDSVAFAIPDGAISEPFATQFGYHIIKRIDHRGVKPLDEMRESIEKAIAKDIRATLPHKKYLADFEARTGCRIDAKIVDKVRSMIEKAGGTLDAAMLTRLNNSDMTAFTVDRRKYTLAQVLTTAQLPVGKDADATCRELSGVIERAYDVAVEEAARQNLEDTNPEYRNLVNEYRDGLLLFEISNRNVWERASSDKEGLNAYFRSHRDQYKWEKPKFKSYIIFATSDSILAQAKKYTDTLTAPVDQEAFVADMNKRFGRDIKVERVIAAQGDNPITDHLGFGADKPAATKSRWNHYYAFQGQILDQPAEPADVRGAVITDYQAELERQWLDTLHKKYPVNIDKKVLDSIR